jgi:hypothetical protein
MALMAGGQWPATGLRLLSRAVRLTLSTAPIVVVGPIEPITAGRSYPSVSEIIEPSLHFFPSSSHKVMAGPNLRLHALCITLLTTPLHTHLCSYEISFLLVLYSFDYFKWKSCQL